ncbi:MAG: thioesterase [Bacteroidetes bacterium]|jgi:acyl-CoA thioester hydrolase|nr:thioesterase [Bacteroidota bacterium]
MTKTSGSNYKIRFNDCDMFGHLNNSSYLDYLINAREDHLKDNYNLSLADYYRKGQGWVVSTHEIAYIRPAVYNETVCIQSTLLSADHESVHVETMMLNEKKDQLKAVMRSRLIHVSTKTGKKEPHDPDFLAWAKSMENSEVIQQGNLQDRIKWLLAELKARNTPA